MTREEKFLNRSEIKKALKERGVPDDEASRLLSKMERLVEKELIDRSSDSDFRSKLIKNRRSSLGTPGLESIRSKMDRLFSPLPFVRKPSKIERKIIDMDLSITRQKVLQDVQKSRKVEIGRVKNPAEAAERLNKNSLATIKTLIPMFEKMRFDTEVLKNKVGLIPTITELVGDSIAFKPAYNFAFQDPEEDYYVGDWGGEMEEDDAFFEDEQYGHAHAFACDYNGVIGVSASLNPWDPQNHHLTEPTELEATAEVGIEFVAWKDGRLHALARIPDLIYSAHANYEGTAGSDQVNVLLWLKASCYKLGPNDEIIENTWDGRFLCPGVSNGSGVSDSYVDTNIIFPDPDYGVMNLQAGDRVKIIITFYVYVFTACMPCNVNATAMGQVSVINVRIKDD